MDMENKPLIKQYICPYTKVRNIFDVRVEKNEKLSVQTHGQRRLVLKTRTTGKQLCNYWPESICPAFFRQFKQLYVVFTNIFHLRIL